MTTSSPANLLDDIVQVDVRYSTFWQRFLAVLVDGLVLLPFLLIDHYNKITWKSLSLLTVTFLITLLYKPFMEAKYGATLGKMALALTIVDTQYQKAPLRNILLRNVFDLMSRLSTGVITIIAFSNSAFAGANTMQEYNNLANIAGALFVTIFATAIAIIDAIFLIADERRRALHDRIGQTYVIQK